MPQTADPFVLKDVSLTLIRTVDIGTGTETEFRCQLTQAQLTPSPSTGGGGGSTMETFCASYDSSGATGSSTWALDLAGFQAWKDVEDFTVIAFNHEGEEYDFALSPYGGTPSASNPAFSGKVTMAATAIGGTAKQYASFTVSLPCTAKPTMVVA